MHNGGGEVEFLIEKFGGFSHAKIVEHCSTGMLWQLVENINDEAIRDYCNDALDPYLRFECLMYMALCETDLMPHLKWCEADVAEDWDGGAWYELQQKIESTIKDLTELTARNATGNKARVKCFDAAFAFGKSNLKGESDWCHTRTRGAVNLVLDHMKKSTGFILQNPVLQLATVMHPDPNYSRAAATKFVAEGRDGVLARAAKWYGLSEVEFVEAAMDERHVGPARAIADPALWQQLTALQAIPSRRKGGTTGIETLLEFSFKYLPVGNAYAEYLVKLVKNSTSESRAYFETMLLKLRARTSLNAWSVGYDDFKLIRSPDAFIIGQCVFIISHSAQPICIPSLMSQINQAHNASQTSLDSQVNARAQQAPAACSSCCNLR